MSFLKRVVVTYGTFVAANWGSNFLLYPDKKLDYGFLNRALGRPVNNEWWGTRSQHIFTIALPLSICDHLSLDMWNKWLLPKWGIQGPLSWKFTPTPMMYHNVSFAITGIMLYVAHDAYFNPLHEGKDRDALVTGKLYPEMSGVMTMWTLGATGHVLENLTGRMWPHGTPLGVIPPMIAFTTVKGFSIFEQKLNEA
ncbi:hypothetical protein DFJ74DRAFT_705026 [Hyaloraphidium curvatum]|nr:hypothetical protein DFJ74DRAFT_705026 [Hyaloraphidium curvatum]